MTGLILVIIGLVIVVTSLITYARRTGDTSIWRRFWADKDNLTNAELWSNRAGLVIAIVGIALI